MIKGKFRRGFNVFYDPKFLFSCDFISIPYSEAGTGVRLLVSTFLLMFSLPASFFFPLRLFRAVDGVWRGSGLVLCYGKYHWGQGL